MKAVDYVERDPVEPLPYERIETLDALAVRARINGAGSRDAKAVGWELIKAMPQLKVAVASAKFDAAVSRAIIAVALGCADRDMAAEVLGVSRETFDQLWDATVEELTE